MPVRLPFLRVDKGRIVDEAGSPVMLRGVCLGGWLLMEGYMYAGRNITERAFREAFEKAAGKEALADFTRSFRDVFFREEDIRIIKGWGANCVRVPFNYRVIEFEDRPFSLNEEGLSYLDRVVEWCQRAGLYCILDMHSAPGGQNPDWHSDSPDKPALFTDEFNKNRYLRLWHFIADRYKDSSAVAGYDILNEPVVSFPQEGMVKDLYEKVTKEIRDTDKRHMIILEGNWWGQRIKFLGSPADKNTVYSVHAYPIADFAFNWVAGLTYPGKVYGIMWNKAKLEFLARQYSNFLKRIGVPFYIGEVGVNWRDGHYGELKWIKDLLDIFKRYGAHWTYWTYKTVANPVFPDGIFRYVENPAWVNRKGPVTGWETFGPLWQKEKGRMINSWRTENFKLNTKLLALLKRYFTAKR